MRPHVPTIFGLSLAIALIVSTHALAGPRDESSASRSGTADSAAASAQDATPTHSTTSKKMDSVQKDNLENLQLEVTSLHNDAAVTDDQKKQLTTDLAATLQGAQKPSKESITKLATDLTQFTVDGKLSTKEVMAIQKDVKAILDSASISDAQVDALKADVKAIADASNLSKTDVETLLTDVQNVGKTAQTNAKSATGSAGGESSAATKATSLRR